jgi:hypothetical protein
MQLENGSGNNVEKMSMKTFRISGFSRFCKKRSTSFIGISNLAPGVNFTILMAQSANVSGVFLQHLWCHSVSQQKYTHLYLYLYAQLENMLNFYAVCSMPGVSYSKTLRGHIWMENGSVGRSFE